VVDFGDAADAGEGHGDAHFAGEDVEEVDDAGLAVGGEGVEPGRMPFAPRASMRKMSRPERVPESSVDDRFIGSAAGENRLAVNGRRS
jgi:hypothetical protein